MHIDDGQCGRCTHFGADHSEDNQLVAIRIQGVAPEGYTDSCGHPAHASLHLRVSANSGCDGFAPAQAA